jgi:transcriptional regulator with XRE-family HTH domain
MTTVAGAPEVGPLLRTWRQRRRFSQQELSNRSLVSTRHLSRVETGRAHPTPAMIMHLADHLDVPLRDRNRLLLAAGYAPRFDDH